MNEKLVEWVWSSDMPVPNWKFVLLAMAAHATDDGEFQGGIGSLSRVTGLDYEDVSNAIISLSARGNIEAVTGKFANVWKIVLYPFCDSGVKTPQNVS